MDFFVNIVSLFIFPVGVVIFLRIPSIIGFLEKVVSLLFTIYWNGRLGVLGQKMQSILPSIQVSVIPSGVVILYVTLQFDMLPHTLIQ